MSELHPCSFVLQDFINPMQELIGIQDVWKIVKVFLFAFSVHNKILYRRNCHITIQKNIRMYLAKKRHQPRYRGIMKINTLQVKKPQISFKINL